MADMCAVPGCPDLACMRASIEDVTLPMCLKHGRAVGEHRTQIEAQLAEYKHGAPCRQCEKHATMQVALGGEWFNHCDRHGREMAEKLTILRGGRPAETRRFRPLIREVPQVRIEEVPIT